MADFQRFPLQQAGVSRQQERAGGRMKSRLKIGAVSYLNTKPLIYHLSAALPQAELRLDLPSRLSDHLGRGELDLALVPVIDCARHPDWVIVSNACIACRGPVLSVKLFFKVPPSEVTRMALDEGSRSSAAMVQIVLREQFGVQPELVPLPIGAGLEEAEAADAVLLIGDRAMHAPMEGFREVWDLGDRWCRWTELPFVFAVWAAGPGVSLAGLDEALERARDWGGRDLETIAAREAATAGLTAAQVHTYLHDHLHFHLGVWERQGLRRFLSQARRYGLVPLENEPQFHDCPTA